MDKSKLQITPAPFIDAMRLQKSIAKAIGKSEVKINARLLEGDATPETIGSFINALIEVGVSDEVEDGVFKCAERALYDNNKIDYDFFENVDNRELFYPIMIEIIKVNCMPFFKKAVSSLSGVFDKVKKPKDTLF